MTAAAHWSEAYLGRPYVEDVFDCAVLAETVRREVFGHDLQLPSERRPGPYGRAIQLRQHLPDFVAPTTGPRDGDAVLIVAKGREQHIGLYCLIGAEPWVLHNIERSTVHRIRVRDMEKWGYKIEGYYRWI